MVEKKNEKKLLDNLAMIPGFMLAEEAAERERLNALGCKYSFGDKVIDDYCGGGWGRYEAYDIICVFGGTGMNKSTLVSQMAISPARKGDKVAYLALEDEMVDVYNRMKRQMQPTGISSNEEFKKVMQNIHFMSNNSGYYLSSMINTVEELFKIYDVIIMDPVQFVFEASIVDRGESEINRQRIFMQKLHDVVVKAKKPLVFVSHTNKSVYDKNSKTDDLGQMLGSLGLPQICSKVIKIHRDKDGIRTISFPKARFTQERHNHLQISLDKNSLRVYFDRTGLTQQQIMDMEANW